MADDILQTAKQEADRLRSELEGSVTFQKLRQVEKLIELYQRDVRGPLPKAPRVPKRSVPRYGAPKKTKTARILGLAMDHIAKNGRATSGEILTVLRENGIEIPGKRPGTAVASILSTSGLFDNVKPNGYGLKAKNETPPG